MADNKMDVPISSPAPPPVGKKAPSTTSSPKASPQKERTCKSGFYVYIGPTIRGIIISGTIYRGSRENALNAAKTALERFPLIQTLIVSGDALPEARQKVKHSGNALYANYHKVLTAAQQAAQKQPKEANDIG